MKSPCFDADTLTRLIDGRLTDKEKDLAETHLAECDACLEEFAMAKTVLNEVDLTGFAPGALETARACLAGVRQKIEKFAGWLAGLNPPEWMLGCQASPVRSQNSGKAVSMPDSLFVKKDIGGLRAEMFIEKSENERACMSVKVFTGKRAAKNISLTLMREGGRPLARFLSREYESFEKLRFGTYHLTVEHNSLGKGDYLFQIDDEGFHER